VAELVPVANPQTRTVVTVTPVRPLLAQPPMAQAQVGSSSGELRSSEEPTFARAELPSLEAPRVVRAEPLTPTETRLHLTVSPAFLEKLEEARLALSHSLPGATVEDVLSIGLDLILDRDRKRKGLVANPRPAPAEASAEPGARYIPAAVRREVWRRDQGRCQWKLGSGGICGSRLRVELDHVNLRCRGARPVAAELRLLCRSHNDLAAREALGDPVMDRYTRKRTSARRT
jgi:hypothetical protein